MDPVITIRTTALLLFAGSAAVSVAGGWAFQEHFRRHQISTAASGTLGYFSGLVAGALGAAQSLTFIVPGTPFDPFGLSVQWMPLLGGAALSCFMGLFVPSMFTHFPVSTRAQVAIAATVGSVIAFRTSPWVALGLCANGVDWDLVGTLQ